MKCLLLIILITGSISIAAQDKVEREYRVNADQIPAAARQWLNTTFTKQRKLKWYYEKTSGKESYEAKFCFRKHRYSVEFSTEGILEDVEIEWKWKKLPKQTKAALQKGFDQIPGFHLQRIQEQWTGSPEIIQSSIQQENLTGITIRYELEFLGTLEGKNALWEGTFSAKGELLSFRKIIIANTDNLDF